MNILLIGSHGTIGSAVAHALQNAGHHVIGANHGSGEYRLDLSDKSSIRALLQQLGRVNAIVATAGLTRFGPLAALRDEDFALGLNNKLMGQIHLLREGIEHLNDGGAVTLTSGALSHSPMPGSAATSPINAAVEGFVRAAALELPRGLRVNAVSPVFVTETARAMGMDTQGTLSAERTARIYLDSLNPSLNGQVLDARDYLP